MLPRRESCKIVSVFGHRDALSPDVLSVVIVFLA